MPLLKPGRWAWNPAELDPEWRPLVKGLIAAWPIWSGTGPSPVTDLFGNFSSFGTPTKKAYPFGVGLEGDGTSRAVLHGRMPQAVWSGTHRTVIAFIKAGTAHVTYYFGLQTQISPATSGGTVRLRLDTSRMRFEFQGGFIVGSTNLVTASSIYGTTYNVVGLTVPQAAADGTLYLNGKPETVSSQGTVAKVQGRVTYGNLLAQGDQTIQLAAGNALLALYVWDRELTTAEHERVAADPFGLIRRHIPVELYSTDTPVTFSALTLNPIVFPIPQILLGYTKIVTETTVAVTLPQAGATGGNDKTVEPDPIVITGSVPQVPWAGPIDATRIVGPVEVDMVTSGSTAGSLEGANLMLLGHN